MVWKLSFKNFGCHGNMHAYNMFDISWIRFYLISLVLIVIQMHCPIVIVIIFHKQVFEKVSIQSVEGGSKETEDDRLGSKAFYAFIYPNFMINRSFLCLFSFFSPALLSTSSTKLSFLWFYRYGPWMDTNLIIPLGPRKCLVVFDYFLEASLKVINLCIPIYSWL